MKEFLIGAAAIVLAGAAFAQTPAPTPVAPPPMAPTMHDRVVTRAEMVAKVREHFAKLDTDRDGFLTKAEAEAGRKLMRERIVEKLGEHHGRPMAMGNPNEVFDRLDTNKDGSLSRDEFAKGREMRVEKRIVMKDGKDGATAHIGKGHHMHRMGMMGGHMFEMADANKDGRVSLQEATDTAARHFDMADANRDGRVTPDERRNMHKQMMEKHRAEKTG